MSFYINVFNVFNVVCLVSVNVDCVLANRAENDKMAIKITNTANGDVILDIPLQTLSGGNLQAHYDQPHK